MATATLEPKDGEINGGEHHAVELKLDGDGYLTLKVDAQCYGAHASTFEMLLCSIGPEQVETFARDLFILAAEMRQRDAEADK